MTYQLADINPCFLPFKVKYFTSDITTPFNSVYNDINRIILKLH